MQDALSWKLPKWPFLAANVTLLVVPAIVIARAAHPITATEFVLAIASAALGAGLGCLPYVLDYRATGQLVEVNALGSVAEQLTNLQSYAAQVATATDQWARVQETTKGDAEKTVGAAREIAERMTAEIREFNEFQVKLNDTEKTALRLEVDKLHRTEGEWLQVVARILDHVFALHTAAAQSGQPELAAQIGQFQNVCRDAARRVGVTLYEAAPEEAFDVARHRVHGTETPPAEGVVAATLAPGLTFQSRLIRPALVRLREPAVPPAAPAEAAAPAAPASASADAQPEAPPAQLTLEAE